LVRSGRGSVGGFEPGHGGFKLDHLRLKIAADLGFQELGFLRNEVISSVERNFLVAGHSGELGDRTLGVGDTGRFGNVERALDEAAGLGVTVGENCTGSSSARSRAHRRSQ
jgi:hypothetical protein